MSIVQQGIRSAMCVPLLHNEETLGVIYGDRVSTSRIYTTEDIDFLAGIARQVSIGLINCRLMEEQQQMVRLNRDLDLARAIQTGLFPRSLPNRDGLRVAALNDPGHRVSGDYYDVIETSDGRIWCLVADVTGEGIPAALLMANLQAAVRLTVETTDDPGALLTDWNRLICRNTDTSKFVTCLLSLIDPTTHRLRFASAGHCPPLVGYGSKVPPRELAGDEPSFPLGVDEEGEFRSTEVDIGPEPFVLLCYTDGVTDAMNAADEPFGRDQLIQTLAGQSDLNPQALVKRIRKNLAGFVGLARQTDDITMLATRVG
jgi:sigma-B regulation protein RsbU (phosphoserine phosphatase)